MDYRYVDQQVSHRASNPDDQQGLNPHQQHLQHLPHFSHQHSLQPPSLPHQHMHHVGQPVFVAATHGREGYNNRRQSGQDLQSILEVAGLVPVRPPTQPEQHQSQQREHQRNVSETRPPPPSMQLHSDTQLISASSQRNFGNVSPNLQQPQPQGDFPRDYRQTQQQPPDIQSNSHQQQGSGAAGVAEAPQQSASNSGSNANNDGCESDPEPPPARLHLKDKLRPGPLPAVVSPPDLPDGLTYVITENDKRRVVGVKAETELEKDAELGIFHGSLVDEATGCVEESSWELCLQGKILYYVDGKYKRNTNWMLYVQCARNSTEQNVEAVQVYGYVRFRTTKAIKPGTELRVFYSDDFALNVGFRIKLDDLIYKKETDNFQCEKCQCTYKSAKRMLRHMKLAHEQETVGEIRPVFNWEVKKKITTIKKSPSARVRNPDNRFICVTCGKDFPTKGRLSAHEAFHEFMGGTQICDHCGDTFENSQMYAKHILLHRMQTFKCETCQKFLSSKASLLRHHKDVHGIISELACDICGKELPDKEELKKHTNWHLSKDSAETSNHGKDKKDSQGEPNAEGEATEGENPQSDKTKAKRTTPVIETAFPIDMLGKRMFYFDRPRPYKCRHCGLRFRQYNQRNYHEEEVHEGKGRFKCPECSQKFATRCNLMAHKKKHNPVRPYQCLQCPKGFASERALVNHQGEHNGLKPFPCTVCGRGFRTQKLMGKHRSRMHGKREKRFGCSFCDKRFMTRSGLGMHERRHKGIRPFVCLVCGKGFSSKDSMICHERVHTGEMPFKCEKCGKEFRNNHNLSNHLIQHAEQGQ